jgi:catechol-2,3-dioxygenase
MEMSRAFQLGYVELGTPRAELQRKYYAEVMGATQTHQDSDGAAYLSLGLDHHNIIIRPSDTAGINSVGLQIADVSLADAARHLQACGVETSMKSDARPGMGKILEVVEPGGHTIELYTEMSTPAPGFRKHGISPNKLGHIALMSPNAAQTVKFFQEALGFHLTDRIEQNVTFLTCNKDHHVLNIINAPTRKLHHLAFELRERAQHHEVSDLLATNDIPVLWGPARHTAGHNLASYHHDPDRVLIELYADMDVYVPELGWFEPRPYHEHLPMKPQVWKRGTLNTWGVRFGFDLRNEQPPDIS